MTPRALVRSCRTSSKGCGGRCRSCAPRSTAATSRRRSPRSATEAGRFLLPRVPAWVLLPRLRQRRRWRGGLAVEGVAKTVDDAAAERRAAAQRRAQHLASQQRCLGFSRDGGRRSARPLRQHRAPLRCTGVGKASSCSPQQAFPWASRVCTDVDGDERQRLLASCDSGRTSGRLAVLRRTACTDERERHLPARAGRPEHHAEHH